jgi:DNA primase
VRIVELEGGLDPDEFVKQHGAETYRERVSAAKTYFYWLADRARTKFNMREPQGRVDAFQFLLPAIQGLNDRLERATVANDLASYLGVPAGLVLDHFRKAAADRVERAPAPKTEASRATDGILLPLLLSDEEARIELIGKLRGVAGLRQTKTAPIYETLFAMHEAGETISFNTLHARIPESLQETLSAIVLDSQAGHEATLDNGLACLRKLQKEDREARLRDLDHRIQTAEREGRMTDVFSFMEERDRLKREAF